MSDLAAFALPQWIDSNKDNVTLALAGSATPSLSIQDLIDLSSDKETTSSNLSFQSLKLGLGPFNGSEPLRTQIAALYNESITAEHIFPTHGTTGANALAFQILLNPGDHVIAMYPSYTQLLSLPKATPGVDISYWTLNLEKEASANIQTLKDLIRPTTKMIIVNNPSNPLGTILSETTQHEIVQVARAQGIYILADEIFRPLFYNENQTPPSFVELSADDYDKIIVTSSMSKAWGLSGTRIGWLATRNASVLSQCFNRGLYTIMALSNIDEIIATEALSDRCRPQILSKHLEIGRKNIALLEDFVSRQRGLCAWTKPCAGGTGFLRFFDSKGKGKQQGENAEPLEPVDDVKFCRELKEKKGVLLAPGSLCFGVRGDQDFRGFARVHITVDPEVMKRSLEAIGEFLEEYSIAR